MIKINRNNYKEYFVDFADGNLTPSEEDQLMLFLDQNQDLKEEFEIMNDHILIPEEVVYKNKENLKRSSLLSGLNVNNFDELCICSLEGDLNKKEENEFQELLKENNEKLKEFNLYKLTRVISDEKIVFPDKSKLKKVSLNVVLRRTYSRISIAASIIVIIALYIFLQKDRVNTQSLPIAEVKYEEVKKEDSQDIATIKDVETNKKIKNIDIGTIDNNVNSNEVKLKVDYKTSVNTDFNENITKISPLDIKYEFDNLDNHQLARVELSDLKDYNTELKEEQYMSMKSVLATAINKRVLKKEEKKKIELFDIAQAGIEGINKLTGSKMSLERTYDKNGTPDKTEFSSKLIAFSAPVKKD